MQTITEQLDASKTFCPNEECRARGKVGQGNIVVHGRIRPRYQCKTCGGRTFSARAGTALEGLRKPTELIVIVITLLAYGCPLQAIVEQGKLDLMHVQADAHSCQSKRNDSLDGASNDGVDTVVAGRSGEPEARQHTGRCF